MGLITGEQFKVIRKTLGYGQTEIANLMGVDQSVISRIETTQTTLTTYYYRLFLEALNINQAEMLHVFNLIMELRSYGKG